jgi:hypothetical protein
MMDLQCYSQRFNTLFLSSSDYLQVFLFKAFPRDPAIYYTAWTYCIPTHTHTQISSYITPNIHGTCTVMNATRMLTVAVWFIIYLPQSYSQNSGARRGTNTSTYLQQEGEQSVSINVALIHKLSCRIQRRRRCPRKQRNLSPFGAYPCLWIRLHSVYILPF